METVTITPKSAAKAAKAIQKELERREAQATWEEDFQKRQEEIAELLKSDTGRKERVDAGICFKSVAFSAKGVSLAYTDREGDKGFTCEEEPRKEFYLAFLAMSYFYCTELGVDLLSGDRKVFFNIKKVTPHIDKKYGVLDGFKISGYEVIGKWAQTQNFSSDRVINLSEKSHLILQKIFDEAYIYLTGDRAQRNLFLEEDEQEEESEDETS